ncbi:hypothetical protein [Geomonas ferrireducens]|uniref:hypothetical protein n=1 Tax=Geomonas ferrireducens TaxID=2570227 RepID=UPI0013A5F076|nr:hypothetical protein [Geomonas ferrireducens]
MEIQNISNETPLPIYGKLHEFFRGDVIYSRDAVTLGPIVKECTAYDSKMSKDNKPGWITNIRWSKHKSMGGYYTNIILIVDGVYHTYPLAAGHENKKDFGIIYTKDHFFELPLGEGVRYIDSFQVVVYGNALPPSNPDVTGGGGLENVFIGWRTDN